MDALMQLMESYLSFKANRFTDAIDKQAYASLLYGIILAQFGLGSVHGLVSPLGAFYPISHGVVCGALVAEATDVNIQSLIERESDFPALDKYVHLAEILCDGPIPDRETARQALVDVLRDYSAHAT